MASEAIPEDVRIFLVDQVRTLMALEMLLMMLAEPGRAWSAAELVRELRCDEEWTARELERLVQRGLVEVAPGEPGRYHGKPSIASSPPVAWLRAAYPEQRFSIIQSIYAAPALPWQQFADAFRLRKDRPHG